MRPSWFTAVDPATLGLVRILGGAMLLYTYLVWTLDLAAFFGPNSWVSPYAARRAYVGSAEMPGDLYGNVSFVWSVFYFADTMEAVWAIHSVALVAIPFHLGIAMFMSMITFGLAMLIGNLAFVRPETTRAVLGWTFRRSPRLTTVSLPPPASRGGSILLG